MKRSIITFLKGILSVIVALTFFVTVSSCQKQEGTMEKAGKKIDESVEAAKDTAAKADKKIDESIDKAKEAMQDTAKKAEEKTKE
jgi:Flp pilus assembly protein TadB